jgi:hypothetical protein
MMPVLNRRTTVPNRNRILPMTTPSTAVPNAPANAPVDPWAMQRSLLKASSQTLPEAPELNRDVMLYGALIIEEVSETMAVTGLAAAAALAEPVGLDDAQALILKTVSTEFEAIAAEMHEASLRIRALLEKLPPGFKAPLAREHAIEMGDGTTDIAVVNCGYVLAMGVDGSSCYGEVGGSNLSKVNPDTGVIDKTPDGKWIKGRNYRKPDLASVIYPPAKG